LEPIKTRDLQPRKANIRLPNEPAETTNRKSNLRTRDSTSQSAHTVIVAANVIKNKIGFGVFGNRLQAEKSMNDKIIAVKQNCR